MFKQSAQHVGTYYAATYGEIPLRARLEGREDAQILIIGGGFSGLHTALRLALAPLALARGTRRPLLLLRRRRRWVMVTPVSHSAKG